MITETDFTVINQKHFRIHAKKRRVILIRSKSTEEVSLPCERKKLMKSDVTTEEYGRFIRDLTDSLGRAQENLCSPFSL